MTATLTAGNLHIPTELLRKHGWNGDARVELEDRKEGILIATPGKQVRPFAGVRTDVSPVEIGERKRKALAAIDRAVGFLGNDSAMMQGFMDDRNSEREREDRAFGS